MKLSSSVQASSIHPGHTPPLSHPRLSLALIQCLSLSPLWLDRPVFLPHWNYIPHNASGQEEAAGFLELIGSTVLLCPGAEQGLAAAPGRVELSGAVGVGEAGRLLRHRWVT